MALAWDTLRESQEDKPEDRTENKGTEVRCPLARMLANRKGTKEPIFLALHMQRCTTGATHTAANYSRQVRRKFPLELFVCLAIRRIITHESTFWTRMKSKGAEGSEKCHLLCSVFFLFLFLVHYSTVFLEHAMATGRWTPSFSQKETQQPALDQWKNTK